MSELFENDPHLFLLAQCRTAAHLGIFLFLEFVVA